MLSSQSNNPSLPLNRSIIYDDVSALSCLKVKSSFPNSGLKAKKGTQQPAMTARPLSTRSQSQLLPPADSPKQRVNERTFEHPALRIGIINGNAVAIILEGASV